MPGVVNAPVALMLSMINVSIVIQIAYAATRTIVARPRCVMIVIVQGALH